MLVPVPLLPGERGRMTVRKDEVLILVNDVLVLLGMCPPEHEHEALTFVTEPVEDFPG